MDNIFNINFPIKDSDSGYFIDLTTNSNDGLLADIKHVLLTTRGTRYYRPSFGANLRKYLFEQNDELTYKDVKMEINDMMKNYFPNVTVKSIEVITNVDVSPLFNENLKGEKTSNKPPSKENTAKVRISLEIKQGAFVSSEIIELQL